MLTVIARVEPADTNSVRPNSIAIMPFEWCADVPRDLDLAGGIRLEINNNLAAYQRLHVTGVNSMNTVVRTAGPGLTPFEVARLFRVQYLLYGEMCREGSDLVIRAELTNREQAVVWQETLRQEVNRYDQVHTQLATLVANGVALKLGEVATKHARAPVSARAHELLIIAQYQSREGKHDEARATLELALEHDPDYADALFELALFESWDNESIIGGIKEAWPLGEEALVLARDDIGRGVQDFRPYRVAAHILMTMAQWEHDLTWRAVAELGEAEIAARKAASRTMLEEAEAYLREAIRLNPSDSELHADLVWNLERQGAERRGEVLEILKRARETDPFDVEISRMLARNLALRGQYARAMEELERFKVLGKIPNRMRWLQQEIQTAYLVMDDKLELLLYMLEYEPERYSRISPVLGFLYWYVSHMPPLGLNDEAESLFSLLATIPDRADASEFECWGRQFFLFDKYRQATGRADEVAREMLVKAEGMSNEEILDRWYLDSQIIAGAFWEVGERQRAIELYEALRYFTISPTWAQRKTEMLQVLIHMYLTERRESDAAPVLEEMVTLLKNELAAGARHPLILYRLSLAYAWQGHQEEALDMLTMAVDYGFWGLAAPEVIARDGDISVWDDSAAWRSLESDPRFEQQLRRQRATAARITANIRALLATHDIDELLAPVIEMHAATYDEVEQAIP